MKATKPNRLEIRARTGGVNEVKDAGRREDGWGDGDKSNSSGEVNGKGRKNAIRWEDGWGEGGAKLASRTR